MFLEKPLPGHAFRNAGKLLQTLPEYYPAHLLYSVPNAKISCKRGFYIPHTPIQILSRSSLFIQEL